MADGTIRIDTELDISGLEQGLERLNRTVSSGFSGIKTAIAEIKGAMDDLGNVDSSFSTQLSTVMQSVQVFQNVQTAVTQVVQVFQAALGVMDLYAAGAQASTIAQMGAGTAATALGTVMAVLTGKIKLATAAQLALNAAQSANVIGLVIGLVAGLVTGFATLASSMETDTDRINASFENMAEGAKEFQDSVKNAESYLQYFNDTLFASSEEQNELNANMEEVQNGITSICRTAAEERRGYTQQEIEQLDNYFQRLQELNQQQIEMERAKTQAIEVQALNVAASHTGSLEEYQIHAQQWIKTAQEQANQEKTILQGQMTNEIALLNQEFGEMATLENEAYKARYENISKYYENEIAAVNAHVGNVTQAFADGYAERAGLVGLEQQTVTDGNMSLESEQQRHSEVINSILEDQTLEYGTKLFQLKGEYENYKDNIQTVWADITSNMDEEQQKQMGVWLSMVGQVELYGGQLSEGASNTAKSMISAFGQLPEETKGTIIETLEPMMTEMQEAEPLAYARGGAFINAYNSGFTAGEPQIIENIHSFTNEAAKPLIDSYEDFVALGAYEVEGMAEGISDSTAATDAITEQVGDVVEAGQAAQESNSPSRRTKREIGIPFAQGVAEGIKAGKYEAINAARQMVRESVTAAEEEGEIGSPSKLMRDEVGEPLAEGVAVGIENKTEEAARAAARTSEEIISAMAEGIDQSGSVVLEVLDDLNEEVLDSEAWYLEEKARIEREDAEREAAERQAQYEKKLEEAEDDLERQELIEEERLRQKQEADKEYLADLKEAADREAQIISALRDKITALYDDIAKRAEERIGEVTNAQDALAEKMKGYGTLYTERTQTFHGAGAEGTDLSYTDVVLDLSGQRAELEQYASLLEQVGQMEEIPDALHTLIREMPIEEAVRYMDALLTASDEELQNYLDDWTYIQSLSENTGIAVYAEDMREAVDETYQDMVDTLTEAGLSIPEGFFVSGSLSAEQFGEGFIEEIGTVMEGVRKLVEEELLQIQQVSAQRMSALSPALAGYAPGSSAVSGPVSYYTTYQFAASGEPVSRQIQAAQSAETIKRMRGQ